MHTLQPGLSVDDPLATIRLHTVHCSLSAVMHASFHASMLRPASQAGPMHETTGVGKLLCCCH